MIVVCRFLLINEGRFRVLGEFYSEVPTSPKLTRAVAHVVCYVKRVQHCVNSKSLLAPFFVVAFVHFC